MTKFILLSLFLLTLAAGAAWLRRGEEVSVAPTKIAQPPKPSPLDDALAQPPVLMVAGETVRTRLAETTQTLDKVSAKELAGNDWAVVVATYKSFSAAEYRARRIGEASQFKPIVFPPEGQGTKYLVVLEDGLTQGKATAIREEAVTKGLPEDTYVTRLSYRQ